MRSERFDRLWMRLAWALPRDLVMWCAIRLWAHATYVYPSDECPSMHMDKCLGAWDKAEWEGDPHAR